MNTLRIILLVLVLWISIPKTYGQLTVYQDEKGQVLTTYHEYELNTKVASHNRVTYLGSPFITFPVWQAGKIWLDNKGQALNCELAYNVVNNEVLCRFAGDSTIKTATPDVFTINGTEFVRKQNNVLGADYRTYFTIIHNGPTKLLTSMSSQLMAMNSTEVVKNSYNRDLNIQGVYRTKTRYYIQKGDAQPELISLSKSSVLSVLHDQAEIISVKLPAKQLTTDDVIQALTYYDALSTIENENKHPLTTDPIFKQILYDNITYPGLARYNSAFGRVYAGFDVNAQGTVQNIVMLSPDNGGAGFVEMVKKALERLPNLNPALRGKYVLPVTFTFTNSKDKTGPHIPLNRLSDDRLEGRTLLEEYVVPFVVSRPVTDTREVWGYYK
jgi:hypothetical protein